MKCRMSPRTMTCIVTLGTILISERVYISCAGMEKELSEFPRDDPAFTRKRSALLSDWLKSTSWLKEEGALNSAKNADR